MWPIRRVPRGLALVLLVLLAPLVLLVHVRVGLVEELREDAEERLLEVLRDLDRDAPEVQVVPVALGIRPDGRAGEDEEGEQAEVLEVLELLGVDARLV